MSSIVQNGFTNGYFYLVKGDVFTFFASSLSTFERVSPLSKGAKAFN